MKRALCLVALVLGAFSAHADVRVSGLFGDNMVLQREFPVPVWGTANPGEKVTVGIGDIQVSAEANALGKWRVQLPALKVNIMPQEMTIRSRNTLTITNLLVGDVWLCSGQSNMGTGFGRRLPPLDPGEVDLPRIRFVHIPGNVSVKPLEEAPALIWSVSNAKTVLTYPTVPWFFGQMVHQQTGVPIGILRASWGGAMVEHWLAPEAMKEVRELQGLYRDFEFKLKVYEESLPRNTKILADWLQAAEKARSQGHDIPPIPSVDLNPILAPPHKLGFFCMYNGMINYLTRFPIKGVLWYQGESSADDGPIYYHKMLALINGWRKAWGRPDMPFYFVQLPNTGGACGLPEVTPKGWPLLREIQARCLSIPNTGMAVTIDIGDEDLHPRNKYDTGRRLAAIALARDFGHRIEYAGPSLNKYEIKGNKVILKFNQIGSGLMVGKKEGLNPVVEDKSGKLRQFVIAGEDRKWHWADAVIDGETIVVSCPDVPKPIAVRYAFTTNPAGCNLYNKEGLPASPFRTDTW